MRRFARRSTGSTCWPSASATAFHRSRDTIVTCRVRLRRVVDRPAPARSRRARAGPSVRGDNACAPPVCPERFPQWSTKAVNTLFQGVKTVHPPSGKGGKRGTKVLNTVGPRRLAKPQQTPGFVPLCPALSRLVPHPKTFVRAELGVSGRTVWGSRLVEWPVCARESASRLSRKIPEDPGIKTSDRVHRGRVPALKGLPKGRQTRFSRGSKPVHPPSKSPNGGKTPTKSLEPPSAVGATKNPSKHRSLSRIRPALSHLL